MEPDFSGYATKANLRCSDGRTIAPDAFKHMDGQQVPLVWMHVHNDPNNVLGHAKLTHRDDGLYAQCYFNDSPWAKNAKLLVEHGDVSSMSIYANDLREKSKRVEHGQVREVSLVLAGANPGAKIDQVRIVHGEGDIETLADEAVIFTEEKLSLAHAAGDEKTVQDVLDSMNEEQRSVLHYMIGQALEQKDVKHSATTEDEGTGGEGGNKPAGDKNSGASLEHKESGQVSNVFDQNNGKPGEGGGVGLKTRATLTHSQMAQILKSGEELGSFKAAVLKHADEYGITEIEVLFPDAQAIENRPEWITRKMEWVNQVLGACRKQPFARIKSLSADLTEDTARAKGYLKGTEKKTQFFKVAKRVTTPTTIYKKQKLDRDDIVDITEFDVVAWLWVEMRFMLLEELARAILIGDGREIDDQDKINEENIRPIAFDDEFYTDVLTVPANVTSEALIEAALRGREGYRGSSPTAYMTQAVATDMLLAKDNLGRRYYATLSDLANALLVKEIVFVPVMAGVMRDGKELLMIICNLADYSIGSSKGGEVTTFDDFDLDWNQYKYLIETRVSGTLTNYKTAQVILRGAGTLVTPGVPTFVPSTGVLTVPSTANVTYKNKVTGTTYTAGPQTAIAAGEQITVQATPNTGYYFQHNFDNDWDFKRNP